VIGDLVDREVAGSLVMWASKPGPVRRPRLAGLFHWQRCRGRRSTRQAYNSQADTRQAKLFWDNAGPLRYRQQRWRLRAASSNFVRPPQAARDSASALLFIGALSC